LVGARDGPPAAGATGQRLVRQQFEGLAATGWGYAERTKRRPERNGAGGTGQRARHRAQSYHLFCAFQLVRLLFQDSGTIFTKVSSSPRVRPDPRLRVVSTLSPSAASSGGAGQAIQRSPSDEELIDAVQRGDHQVASVIYERLVGVVDHTLYRVFGRREVDHDDLVQAAFEQIVVTLSRRSYARACSLRTWASSIASHVGFNALRSRRRERRVLDREAGIETEPARAGIDVEGEASARAELERLRVQLSEMKSTHAEAVFLHDVLGHELAEIALMTQVSVSAAQSRLVRGRRELFRRLDHVAPRRKSEPS
jgi:RNA polymerase sigma-70 factor (ECF subfamily)